MTTSGTGGVDWRRVIIYTHRWLGIAGCLVFLVWFVSGVVMMYARMPRLTAEERLARLPELDLSHLNIAPAQAARTAAVTPRRVGIGMLGDRPVYRFEADGQWSTVFADSGERLQSLGDGQAVALLRQFLPEFAQTMRPAGQMTRPDQWTLDGGLPRFLPMRRVDMGDRDGTVAYVSEISGEVVMKTTASGRFWGFTGAVLHWLYFTPFREQRELWRYTIIYAALIGCVMCLSGLVVGVWRLSLSKRYRLKGERSHSPYAGLMWWHHYAGLVFGLFSFTWALSGAMSLTPWDWTPFTDPTAEQEAAVSGGPLRLDQLDRDRLLAAQRVFGEAFPVKELEILQFRGRPFIMAYRPPSLEAAQRVTNPDLGAARSVQLAIDHRLAWADDLDRPFVRLPDEAMAEAARASMPGVPVIDERWLSEYDAYYYDRYRAKPIPVLRIQFGDPDQTWLYLDPHNGLISLRYTTRSRLNRWLYNGLHSWDFPLLYYRRPAWDLLLIVLSLGGVALSVTTMWPAWRRLRRQTRW